VNDSGTTVSEKVHLGELDVILQVVTGSRGPFHVITSLAVPQRHRYKPATSIGAFQG
jgi:hypothetical protein